MAYAAWPGSMPKSSGAGATPPLTTTA
jgi:hypothetical protein